MNLKYIAAIFKISISIAGLSASRFSEASLGQAEPRIQTQPRTYQVEAGAEVTLECRVQHLGAMVLMWKQVREQWQLSTLCSMYWNNDQGKKN